MKIQSDTFESETPQRKRYIVKQLKGIMKENNLKSFKSLKEYLENPETSEETSWSIYIKGSNIHSEKLMSKTLSKGLSKTQKAKEKIFDNGKFKQFGNIERLETKKYGYHNNKRIEIFVEKRLYRGEFQLIARDKKGKFASFVKK